MRKPVLTLLCLALAAPAFAQGAAPVKEVQLTEWKAVFGTVEARLRVPARARIGGTITELAVTEGDVVAEGQVLARIVDPKLGFQLSALEAQKTAAEAQLANAQGELKRGQELLKQGVTTAQRLDALRTQVDVVTSQIAALEAQARVIRQSEAEGEVLAPAAGRVLEVPVAKGAVAMSGEAIATLSAGGTFLRISVPERHAASLHEGDAIQIEGAEGRLAKVYPLIAGGRVTADVEVPGLPDRFIDARVLVRLPVGQRAALVVPEGALTQQSGLDFVRVEGAEGPVARAVVPGQHQVIDGQKVVEILSGLTAGDRVLGGGNE
jgi:RND family efflux transporter MFP subunit